MNLYIRLLITIIKALLRPKITDPLVSQKTRFHVLPNDLDLNGHMNNGRYPTIMDLGRLDLIMRTGILKIMLSQKSVPVLGALKMRFRLPLMPFQAYDLETQIICWDKKWVYMQQRFIIVNGPKSGAVAAIALVKGGFYDQKTKTTVPTQSLIDILGLHVQSPNFPDYILDWIKAEETLKAETAQ